MIVSASFNVYYTSYTAGTVEGTQTTWIMSHFTKSRAGQQGETKTLFIIFCANDPSKQKNIIWASPVIYENVVYSDFISKYRNLGEKRLGGGIGGKIIMTHHPLIILSIEGLSIEGWTLRRYTNSLSKKTGFTDTQIKQQEILLFKPAVFIFHNCPWQLSLTPYPRIGKQICFHSFNPVTRKTRLLVLNKYFT